MVQEGEKIRTYMRDKIDKEKHEVFILLERKTDSTNRDALNYNYWCKGENLDMLMSLAEIVDRVSKQMGLSFDDTVEVMKNVHLQDKTMIRTRFKNRIDRDWMVME